MDKTFLDPLNKLEASLNSLVQSLVTTNTFSAAPKAAKDLVAADDELTSALVTLKRHQDNHNEILRLRAEAERLNQNIKDTIRTCVSLRNEFGDIHPSILEDSDEDEEAEEKAEKYNTVDYNTLLAFAFRIGKHNAIARIDAERETERADIEAKRKRDSKDQGQSQSSAADATQPLPNGPHAGESANTTQADTTISANNTQTEQDATIPLSSNSQNDLRTQQVQNVLRQMRHLQRITHMEQSAPYPDANLLRIGELGRIHYIRELEGEQAADRLVENMVRKAELSQAEDEHTQRSESPELKRRDREQRPAPVRTQPRPAKPKKAFDVDFPGGDDDDEDEDEDD